jgi:hypothetical protein
LLAVAEANGLISCWRVSWVLPESARAAGAVIAGVVAASIAPEICPVVRLLNFSSALLLPVGGWYSIW